MDNICCIVGAGEMTGTQLRIPEGAFVIAADAGLQYLTCSGISPDLIVGDFDSLGVVPSGSNVLRYPPEKDDTDLMLSIKEALARFFDTIVIYGGLGGRFDHSIANLQALNYIAQHGAMGFLVGCGCICTVIRDRALRFSSDTRGLLSVFSMGETAVGVELSGVKYPLNGYTLTNSFPLGVSNELEGDARVSVKEGALAVIWQADTFKPGQVIFE